MLIEIPKISSGLYYEWQQLVDEGYQVEAYQERCREIAAKAYTPELEKEAVRIMEEMQKAKIKKEYCYSEPSDYEGIQNAKPAARHRLCVGLPDNSVSMDKLLGAWTGRVSGCLLGKPVEGIKREEFNALLKASGNYPLRQFLRECDFDESTRKEFMNASWYREGLAFADNICGIAPIDDDTNYTVLALKVIEKYGIGFEPDNVLEAWLSWLPVLTTYTAERTAYKNAVCGMSAPETAVCANPYREWIGAQIRGDFYGYINPGKPEKAAELAWRDASISHVKNGIYGEMFIAAMLAAAWVSDDVHAVIEAGLDEIPEKCRLREAVECVIGWYNEGWTAEQVTDKIHERYDEYSLHHWCHTISNAMIVVMALLYGGKDYGNTICLAVQAAFDTDCNGATAGSVLGMMIGFQNIPQEWYECCQMNLQTSISGYFAVGLNELADRTLHIINEG